MRTYLSEDLFAPGIDAHEISLGQHEALAQPNNVLCIVAIEAVRGCTNYMISRLGGGAGLKIPQKA